MKTISPKAKHFAAQGIHQSACLQKRSSQTMATPKKAIPPKKTKETKKPSSKKKDNNNIKKTSNGSVAAVRSPSAKSQKNREQNGGKSTKTPTPKSNKGKRMREEEVEEKEDVKSYTFPMERIKRIIRAEDSDLRISSDAIFLVNKATVCSASQFSVLGFVIYLFQHVFLFCCRRSSWRSFLKMPINVVLRIARRLLLTSTYVSTYALNVSFFFF